MPATIVSGPLVVPDRRYYGRYFPAFGRQPGYGRREIEPPPNRKLPPPAPTYERFWGAESMPLPATIETPAAAPQINVDLTNRGRRARPSRRSDRHRGQPGQD